MDCDTLSFRVVRLTPLWLGLLCYFTGASILFGAESPNVSVSTEKMVTVDTVTSSQLGGARAHINFPYLKQNAQGDFIANYSVGQTQSGTQFGRQAVSVDGGETWTLRMGQVRGDGVQASLIRPAGQLSHGFGVSQQNAAGFTSFTNSRYNSNDGGLTWDNGNEDAFYSTGGVNYSFLYGNFGDVVEAGGSLYMSLYGTRPGSSRNESVLFVSEDDGKHWTRRSTIASYTNSLDRGQMGTEGPSETALLGLDNGDLLAVYRTGQPFPNSTIDALSPSLFTSISHDHGVTWTAPKSLGVAGVIPLLRKLDDGNIGLTFGRYGAKIMVADASGTRWTTPFTIYNGPGSGHTEMRRQAAGKYVFVYDQSGFYPPSWNAAPPAGYVYDSDQTARLVAAHLSIHLQPPLDPVNWLLEYHGNDLPTAVGQGWTDSQGGFVSTRLQAELGQDYLRLNTGLSGEDNSASFALSGNATTAWSEVDFSQGVILELRARVGANSTAEGSATISLSDGVHGGIALELDGDSVNLEGLGGNAGQVEFTTTSHAGFLVRNWHDYRLVVHPGSDANLFLAELYLDHDYNQPILTQTLGANLLDEIRFGDIAGTNNGILELDYLRFASLPGVRLAGDYNGDQVVDSADYSVWRDHLGSGSLLPNDLSPASVTSQDYAIWKANYANSSDGASLMVPEVNCGLGILCWLVTCWHFVRR